MNKQFKTDVLIHHDAPGCWSAIGVDIDYAAGGNSRQEVINNFSRGLKKTIELHIAKFGNADRIMSPPPADEIAAFGESPERYTEIISL